MAEDIHSPLLALVKERHLIDDLQYEEVAAEHKRAGTPIIQLLQDYGVMDLDAILQVMADYLNTDVVNLREKHPSPDLLAVIPADTARLYECVPVEQDGGVLRVAFADPLNPSRIDELGYVIKREIQPVVADPAQVLSALDKDYGEETADVAAVLKELGADKEIAVEAADNADLVEDLANQAPIVKFVNLVLQQAVLDRASDIHFEPFEDEFKIRYRVDGALYEMSPPPKHLALPVISRIKVISGLNIAERRLPQDGRIQLPVAGRMIDFRVSTLPTQFGESVVLRVLDRSVVSLDLENIGMPDDVYQYFGEDIDKPNGIVIVTGPTGSGKTTTLYSALRRLNTIENKLLTAEEPVEYDIDGIVQVPIHEAIGVTFGKVLRAFLRQDPDIIMVGEIRDIETSEISIQAALTGHLVFSTLHTNDASGAITRLIDMGVEPFLIASTLEAVLGQRLVRTICNNCKTPYQPTPDLLQQLGMTESQVGGRPFYYGAGCSYCNQTGYKGRRGIYEYLRIKDPIRDLISQRKPTLVIRDKAVELGMRTLREDGIRCILDGYTTVEEVLKYT